MNLFNLTSWPGSSQLYLPMTIIDFELLSILLNILMNIYTSDSTNWQ
jgi:hypothetical protein